jgi:UDP:flavonoid glycosyltransferase YjiC (YdhE family)
MDIESVMQARERPVVLLVAEAVTLAHFARIVTLARALDPARYDVVVSADPRYLHLADMSGLHFHPIKSIPGEVFARALEAGKPLYDTATLERYVVEDIDLLARIKPDLVVGDFRLSLAVSAPISRVPYAALVNAYWSPYAKVTYPVPDLPFTKLLGLRVSQWLFDRVRPLAFARHARPLNRVCKRHGLPELGDDLRRVYSWGDYTLYTDVPDWMPMSALPDRHQHIGVPRWSTGTPLPDWWSSLPTDKPVVLITLGSSGQGAALPAIVAALAELPLTIIAVAAGKAGQDRAAGNVFVADYLPLDQVISRAQLLISNGGSLTACEALIAGVPVLGVCFNMDQMLNMQAVERLGAGITLRGARANAAAIREAALRLLEDDRYARAAYTAGEHMRAFDPGEYFRAFVERVLSVPPH